MLDMQSDSVVIKLFHEVRLPVPLQARRIEAIEHTLQHWKRHGGKEFEGRPPEAAQRLQYFIRLLQRPVVAPDQGAHLPEVQLFRERRSGRHGEKSKEAADLFRSLHNELAIPPHDVGSLIQIP